MNTPERMDRREAIKWMLAASATVSLLNFRSFGAGPAAVGYGGDPNLLATYQPGELWPLTLTREQLRAAMALCDVIIPGDDKSPSAGSIGVPEFLDEWVSAPYPEQQGDKTPIVEGLAWLDAESQKRFKKVFAELSAEQKHGICDDICYLPNAKPEFKNAASFFAKFRNLTAGAFYSTPQGWKDLQYMGNVALTKFDGPPPEVMAHLKLT